MLVQSDPVAAERLLKEAEGDVQARWSTYKNMAATKEQNS